jgi:hypothetical protein
MQLKLGNLWIADVSHPLPHEIDIDHMHLRLETDRRFSGNPRAYTIAAHQELVAKLAFNAGEADEVVEWALYHDCHEFITGDIPTPIKRLLGERVQMIEVAWDRAIAGALGVAYPTDKTRGRVSIYDKQAASIEWHFKMGEDDHPDFARVDPNLVPEGWL